ncbi:MAG TPA: PAS domain S-box protein [Leptolyngbyaceae cyanobacterium]
MENTQKSREELLAEIESLRERLAMSEETLQAIQKGEVDALVISTQEGERIFTLQSADHSYRLIVEKMQQGAAIVSTKGLILYCNKSFANLLKQPIEKLIGSQFSRLIYLPHLSIFERLVEQAEKNELSSAELFLTTYDSGEIPVYLSVNHQNLGDASINCIVITDLTEQKLQEKIIASERLARLILEEAGEAILVCNHSGQIIGASHVANRLWGENLQHQSFDKLSPLYWVPDRSSPTSQQELNDQTNSQFTHCQLAFSITSVLRGKSYQGSEVQLQRQDGQVFNLVLNARPLTDLDNHFRGCVVILTDITRRKHAELAMQQREEILQLFFKYVPTGIAMFDRQMRYLIASQRWIEEYNLESIESLLGQSHYDIFPDIPERWKQIHQRCLAGATERCEADCFEREDGSIHWIRWEVRPWYLLNQEIGGIILFAEDITKRRQTEASLQESQLQLQHQLAEIEAIYQSAPIGLNILDSNLRFVRINQRLAEINGLPIEAHLGRTVREVLPEMADSAEKLLRSILETGEPVLNVEISGETPAQPGIQRTWLESFLPLKDGDRIIGISTVCEEITNRKKAEEELRRAKEELEIRVAERTEKLKKVNDRLQEELFKRGRIEKQLRHSEARYRAIVEDQTEMIVRFAPDSTIRFVNQAYCRYFGIEENEIIGKSYNPVIYEADQEKVAELVQSMSIENPTVIIENRVIDGRGEVRWTQWVNRMLFDQGGNLLEVQAVGRDITQLKQIEQALRESKERLLLALEASGDGIWDWNLVTNEIYYSPQYLQMLGYEPDELPHTVETWEQLVHPDDMCWVKELLAQYLQNKAVCYQFDYRLQTKSGEWKWIADYGKVVARDEKGNPLRMIGTHQDINDRKIMEAALRHSEEQRRLALDLSHLGFWDLHIPSGNLTWNDNHFKLLGLPASSTAPNYQDWRNCIHPEDVEYSEENFLNSIKNHIDYGSEYRVVHPDGSVHWLMARGRAIYDEDNQPLRSLGVILDISERKEMEASLQESDRRWRSLLDNVQLVVIGLNINGNVEYANPFFLELTGYLLEEVIGQDWFDSFLTPGQKISTKLVFREVLEHNFHTHYQNPIVTKLGEERMIAWSNTILQDTSGQVIGTISIGEDITERYKVERMKAEFISVVSHELRTPLTSMQAALSLLSEKIIDPASEEGEATIQIATEGTDRLVRLVNDILDLERLESGKIRLEKHLCKVNDLVDTAIAQMQEMANQAELSLTANSCDFQIEADPDRLIQVLTNLFSNAIKFSPRYSVIQLSVNLMQLKETQSFLLFTVRDQGRGIPVNSLESIFERFHQVDASDSRDKGGTGLGLAICRSIVRQHGGEIWAESRMGEGSTFYFTIPMVREEN